MINFETFFQNILTLSTEFDVKIAFFLFTTFVTSHLSFDLSIKANSE